MKGYVNFTVTAAQLRRMREDIRTTPGANGVIVEVEYVDDGGEVKTVEHTFTLRTIEQILARLDAGDRAMRN